MAFPKAQPGPGMTHDQILDQQRLTRSIVHKLWPRFARKLPWEDALQEGYKALVKAAKHYRPESGYAFSTYLFRIIRNELIRADSYGSVVHVPRTSWQGQDDTKQAALTAYYHTQRLPRLNQEDLFLTYDDCPDDRLDVASLLARLYPHEQQVLRWYYGIGCNRLSSAAIGRRLGLCAEMTRLLLLEALKRLRRQLKLSVVNPPINLRIH